MSKLENKVAIVTGGGKGIGYGVASAFAREGANLVITGRTLSTLEKAKIDLEKEYGIKVLPVVADGANEDAVKNVIEETIKNYGQLDILVNNAQVSKSGVLLVDHSKEDFDLAINSGLYATFNYMKYSFPYLKKSIGKVINFASGAGISGRPGQASYAAAKEGIRGLSRVAATEWGEHGINVNVVCPLAMTPGLEKWKQQYPEMYAENIKSIPLGRFGDATEDIGRVCVFLASDDSSYITGETISVQGGSGMRP
ncbi:SDR family NAD(P)-dependent oxidoreductase [Clostridium chauvoei]|uniref:Ketoreductase domain-containing protein n=2 Tax=Clostridium chauvoei TaxID=46867 RepID=S6EMW8_9CLOT|nr:SDR family oxidoreductase [Clostridium chauvoei]ATD54120.1 short-chain dehydrogenase [Clostridium chauvoei]ATD58433.1 short-chain dehydrogenase [Clostridium chauvoei]MBX7281603.1 SDR family oxidoreductase [Clostridium chauvoei]MBX7284123.1 SDR family oxidoreductase [Clostridium chauvoei]MBX7286651.1 SDR family oxidoreductase [Clostridium chauvoei]